MNPCAEKLGQYNEFTHFHFLTNVDAVALPCSMKWMSKDR